MAQTGREARDYGEAVHDLRTFAAAFDHANRLCWESGHSDWARAEWRRSHDELFAVAEALAAVYAMRRGDVVADLWEKAVDEPCPAWERKE